LQAWLFPRRVLLELGDQAITALALRHGQVVWLERIPLPEGLCQGGEPQQPEALGDLIGDLLIERGWALAHVRAVLPAAASHCRLVEWPDGQWPADPEAVLLERQEQLALPVPLHDADLRLVPLALDPPTSLLVAVPADLLEAWIAVFATAGVALDGLEAASLCLCRGLEPLLREASSDQLTALVELGAQTSQLLLVRHGLPVYERRWPSALEPAELAVQIRQCQSFWRQQDPGAAGLQVLLHGSRAAAPGWAEALETPVLVVDPLALGWWQPAQLPPSSAAPAGVELLGLWGLALAEQSP
jgi:Tfp pilus assembly PilM family ATPase